MFIMISRGTMPDRMVVRGSGPSWPMRNPAGWYVWSMHLHPVQGVWMTGSECTGLSVRHEMSDAGQVPDIMKQDRLQAYSARFVVRKHMQPILVVRPRGVVP